MYKRFQKDGNSNHRHISKGNDNVEPSANTILHSKTFNSVSRHDSSFNPILQQGFPERLNSNQYKRRMNSSEETAIHLCYLKAFFLKASPLACSSSSSPPQDSAGSQQFLFPGPFQFKIKLTRMKSVFFSVLPNSAL